MHFIKKGINYGMNKNTVLGWPLYNDSNGIIVNWSWCFLNIEISWLGLQPLLDFGKRMGF
jgi:hypothetical protein